MHELIGDCQECGKHIYCENGFFDGEKVGKMLLCHTCAEKYLQEEDEEKIK